jgi:Ca2+-binding RTX toxin-like protein
MLFRLLKLYVLAMLTVSFSVLTYLPSVAATIIVVNNDGPNEGFNDPASFTPVGGNNATTRGQARLNAFQAAADFWGQFLQSDVVIKVGATFDSMGGSSNSAILGSAGAYSVHNNFANQPVPNTLYPVALANSIAGTDLNGSANPEIIARFNSDVDNSSVLGSVNWYYGLDGNSGGHIDFFTVVLHELGHGLGFIDLIGDNGSLGTPGIYDRNLVYNDPANGIKDLINMTTAQRLAAITSGTRLLWNGSNVTADAGGKLTNGLGIGGRVQMYAPNPVQPGSSVAHYNTAVSPNEMMEPSYTGPNFDAELTLALFEDLGWSVSSSSASAGCNCDDPNAILGDDNDNVLDGTAGDDVICGLGGNDTINGFGGNDCLDGGEGDDTISGGKGRDVIYGGPGNDVLSGNVGDDTIEGGDDNDTINGGKGNDILKGEDGDDILRGNQKMDTLNGGLGTDDLNGGLDIDTCMNGEINNSCEN